MKMLGTLVCVAFFLACFSYASEVTESYDLVLNGKAVTVQGGAATNLTVDGRTIEVSVKRNEFKRFDDGTVAFLFPANHSLEKDHEDDMTTWTLDGDDTVLTVYKLVDSDSDAFAKELIKTLSETYGKSSKVAKCEGDFGGRKVQGTSITAKIVGETITQKLFNLGGKGTNYLIMLQHGEPATAELRVVNEKLKETFKQKASK